MKTGFRSWPWVRPCPYRGSARVRCYRALNKVLGLCLLSVDGFIAIGVALVQLILWIVLAVRAIYLALNFLDKLTKGVKEFEEIKKGNIAVALEMAGVIIAVAVIIQSGVIGITAALV